MKITIKQTSDNLTKFMEFNLKNAQAEKMREAEGEDLNIAAWMITENLDEAKNESFEVLTIQEAGENGLIYSTSSSAFIDQFRKAIDDLGTVTTIRVEVRKTKKTGREYLSFRLIA